METNQNGKTQLKNFDLERTRIKKGREKKI